MDRTEGLITESQRIEQEIQEQAIRQSYLMTKNKKKEKEKLTMYTEFSIGFFLGLILSVLAFLLLFIFKSRHLKEGIIVGNLYCFCLVMLSVAGYCAYHYSLLY